MTTAINTLTAFNRSHRSDRSTSFGPISLISATSMSVEPEFRSMVRPAVPNYLLRRMIAGLVAVVAVFVVAAGSLALLAGFGSRTASASAAQPATSSAAVHVAEPGDTLWSIAGTYRGDVSRDRYIDALVRMNNGTSIRAGQAVSLP